MKNVKMRRGPLTYGQGKHYSDSRHHVRSVPAQAGDFGTPKHYAEAESRCKARDGKRRSAFCRSARLIILHISS